MDFGWGGPQAQNYNSQNPLHNNCMNYSSQHPLLPTTAELQLPAPLAAALAPGLGPTRCQRPPQACFWAPPLRPAAHLGLNYNSQHALIPPSPK